ASHVHQITKPVGHFAAGFSASIPSLKTKNEKIAPCIASTLKQALPSQSDLSFSFPSQVTVQRAEEGRGRSCPDASRRGCLSDHRDRVGNAISSGPAGRGIWENGAARDRAHYTG